MANTPCLSSLAYAAVFVALGAAAAHAHARLDHAVPAAGASVSAAPQQVELSFSETVEPAFSTVEVLDQKGEHFEQGKPELVPGNERVLRVVLKPVPSGTYKVVWRVTSVDTHRSSGSFTLTVGP